MKRKIFKNRYTGYAFVACSAVFLYVLLTNIGVVAAAFQKIGFYFAPLIGGIVIAYILSPVANFFSDKCFAKFKKRGAARILAVFITVLLFLAILFFIAFSLIPHLIKSIESLAENMDSYIEAVKNTASDLQRWIDNHSSVAIDLNSIIGSWDSILQKIVTWLPQSLEAVVTTSYKIGTGLFNSVIVFIIAVYLLIDKDSVLSGVKNLEKALLREKTMEKADNFFKNCHKILIRYIDCNVIDALFVGVANFLFMVIFDMPYALLISVLAGLFNMIPTFGPIISLVISGVILCFVNPWTAFWFVIWTIILQGIDGYLVKPLFFGDSMGLASVWILCSIIICGRIFGFIGLLIGIPVAAILSYILKHYVKIGIQKRELEKAQRSPEKTEAAEINSPQKEMVTEEEKK